MKRLPISEIKNVDTTIERLYELVDNITKNYPKTSCSLCPNNCCTHKDNAAGHKITKYEFNYLKPHIDYQKVRVGESGECRLLGQDFRCTVYSHRPLECRLYQIIDKVGRLSCPDESIEYSDKEVAIREVLYRLLYTIVGSDEVFNFRDMVDQSRAEYISDSSKNS